MSSNEQQQQQNVKTDDDSKSTLKLGQLPIIQALLGVGLIQLLYKICLEAYQIRLYAIQEFGRVIHEFDPYFNYRATEYLYEHGWYKFRTWFDYLVWYPLGRPVGTTIYPGMQVTAVFLKNHLTTSMSINDICVFIPAWFGVTATIAVAWLTYECTRWDGDDDNHNFDCIFNSIPIFKQIHQWAIKPAAKIALRMLEKLTGSTWGLSYHTKVSNCAYLVPVTSAVAAAAIMSVVPAHLLRSVGGGYDNESIAMTAMVLVFACWTASLRDDVMISTWQTVFMGIMTGIAYFYMVAAWGGYVFVLNVVGIHATTLVLLGRYTTKLHRAYSLFYLVGTCLAIQVPVVGWTPLKSLEQLGPFATFCAMQLIEICEMQRRRRNLSNIQTWKLRVQVFCAAAVLGLSVVFLLAPTGYFGPISARVRGLFVKHTKTGNPLVDSVAEHQAANPEAYFQYLHDVCYIAPVAFAITALFFFNDSSSFLIVYGLAAYYFSHRMVRLILLTAPIASALGGIFIGRVAVWMLNGAFELVELLLASDDNDETAKKETDKDSKKSDTSTSADRKGEKTPKGNKSKKSVAKKNGINDKESKDPTTSSHPLRPVVLVVRLLVSYYVVTQSLPFMRSFHGMSHAIAKQISHPTIINKGTTKSGEVIVVDDYRDAYWWLRDNTPEDARIMAWWDYGYQITGIANRTTIADGNTWNHEHIALLGRILTSSEKEAHRIARHLADYVLVWAGGGGDDVAKSPHLRRIANSVYRGLCREPTCRDFGFYQDGSPTKAMEKSLLYKLHSSNLKPGVEADRNRFKEVYMTKHGKVRIYKIQSVSKESKEWVENNRICDTPGGWFCRGQYPPALQKILKEKRDFKQLEDFNVDSNGEDDADYQKEYFENLGREGPLKKRTNKQGASAKKKPSPMEIDMINEQWENSELTSALYEIIAADAVDRLKDILKENPALAHIRSEDGRGPMFWAHEMGRDKIIALLKRHDVSEKRTDGDGKTPLDLSKR